MSLSRPLVTRAPWKGLLHSELAADKLVTYFNRRPSRRGPVPLFMVDWHGVSFALDQGCRSVSAYCSMFVHIVVMDLGSALGARARCVLIYPLATSWRIRARDAIRNPFESHVPRLPFFSFVSEQLDILSFLAHFFDIRRPARYQ